MAFPYLSENGFESGTLGHFDAETDTESRLDFPHYSDLARVPARGMPYRGAYCMRVALENDGTPANAFVRETGSWDTAAAGTIFFRFMFYVSRDIVMANNDEFAIFQMLDAGDTVEGGAYIQYTTANGFRIAIGEGTGTSALPLTLGVWHCLELRFVIDSGVGNDGTIDGWLDGAAFTQVTGRDQAAIASGVLGVLGQDAGTTAGTLLFDDVIADDARIFPPTERFPEQFVMTASGHVFVGEGELAQVELLSGAGTDNVLSVFDTDRAYTSDASAAVLELKNTANGERVASDDPVRVHRGAYIALSGTNPRALVKIGWASAYSEGAMRNQAFTRKVNVLAGG